MQYNYVSGDPVEHEQVTVYLGVWRVEVDILMRPLILALWARGYRTVSSCQEMMGRSMIGFENMEQAVRFVREVPWAEIMHPTAANFEHTPADDPFRHGAVAVTFPCVLLVTVTRQFGGI
jgi:hypothetical protein